MEEVKFERKVHSNNGALASTAATDTVAELAKDCSYGKGIYVPSDSSLNAEVLMREGRAGVYPSFHKAEASVEIEMVNQDESAQKIEDDIMYMPTATGEVKREECARGSVGNSVEKHRNAAEQDKSVIEKESTMSPSRPLDLESESYLPRIGCKKTNKELLTVGDKSMPKEDHMLLESRHTRTKHEEAACRFDDSLRGGENSTCRAEHGKKTEPSEETHTAKGDSSISDRLVDIALTIATSDTFNVGCEIHSQIKNNYLKTPCEVDGSHDEAASVGKSRKGGSFITKLVKKGIQKISHTLGKGKEQVFKKEAKGATQNSAAGEYVEVCTPKSKQKSKDESRFAQSTIENDGKESQHPLSCQTAADVKSFIDFNGSSVSSGDELDRSLIRGNLAGSIRNDDNKVMSTDSKIGECVDDDEKLKAEVYGRSSLHQELPEGTESCGKVDTENDNNEQLSTTERIVTGINEVGKDALGEVEEALHDLPRTEFTTGGGDIDREEQKIHKTGCKYSNCISRSQPLPTAETEQNISYNSALGIQTPLPLTVETEGITDREVVECRPRLSTDEFTAEQGLEALCEAACIEMEKNKLEVDILKDGGGTFTDTRATAHISNEVKREERAALAEDVTSPRVDNAADRSFSVVKKATEDANSLVESEEVTKRQICEGEKMLAVSIESDSANPRRSDLLVPKEGAVSGLGRDSFGNVCSPVFDDPGLSTNCDQTRDEVEANRDMPCRDVVGRFGTTERSNAQCDARDIETECSNAVDSGMNKKKSRNSLPSDGEEKKLEVLRVEKSLLSKCETVTKEEDTDQLRYVASLGENRSREEKDDHFDCDVVDLGVTQAGAVKVEGDLKLLKKNEGDISECASQKTSAGDEKIIEEQQESETVGLLEEKNIKLEAEVAVEKDLESGKKREVRVDEQQRIEIGGDGCEVLREGKVEKGVDEFSRDRITLAEIEEMKEAGSAFENVAKEKSAVGSDCHLESVGVAEKEKGANSEDEIKKRQETESKKHCADYSNDKRDQNIAEGVKDDGRKEFIGSEEMSRESDLNLELPQERCDGSQEKCVVSMENFVVSRESCSSPQESRGASQESIDVSQKSSVVSQKSSSVSQESYSVSQKSSSVSQESYSVSQKSSSMSQESSGVSQESYSVAQKSSSVSQESSGVFKESSDVSLESSDKNRSDAGMNVIVDKLGCKINMEHEASTVLDVDTKNHSNSMKTPKRQKPDEEGETFASKMLKLDVADGEVDVEIKLGLEKDSSRSGNSVDNAEVDNAEIKKGRESSDASSKVQALKAGDSTLSKMDTGLHTSSDKALYEKAGSKRELSVVYEHFETREDVLSSTNPEQISDGKAKNCTHLHDIEVMEPGFHTKHQESYADCVEGQVTRQKSSQIVADDKDNCLLKDPSLEVRVELTDALECIRQYQESSDDESVVSTSVDGEVADFPKNIKRQSDGSRESYATMNESESGGSTGAGQEEIERQGSSSLPDSRDKGAGVLTARSRRYSTTESDARPRSDKPKRRKSAADSDLTDGSRIVLTRRMRRESGRNFKFMFLQVFLQGGASKFVEGLWEGLDLVSGLPKSTCMTLFVL